MELARCDMCVGSGQVMGGGMIMRDCEKCLGVGKLAPVGEVIMNKNSDSYKSAKDKIKALDETMSDETAEKILDEELGKLDEENKHEVKKRGRPRKD